MSGNDYTTYTDDQLRDALEERLGIELMEPLDVGGNITLDDIDAVNAARVVRAMPDGWAYVYAKDEDGRHRAAFATNMDRMPDTASSPITDDPFRAAAIAALRALDVEEVGNG